MMLSSSSKPVLTTSENENAVLRDNSALSITVQKSFYDLPFLRKIRTSNFRETLKLILDKKKFQYFWDSYHLLIINNL